jgi:uncharacterized membrane protein
MWARICEILIGIWLIVSHFLFQTELLSDLICGVLLLVFAALSFMDKLNKMHLFQVAPAMWLLYLGYAYPTPWLPMFLQNLILSGLSVLMFAIIPSHASDHPRAWKRFLKKRD